MQSKIKSRSFARKKVRTVRGTKTVYLKRKPRQGVCHVTGQTLKGIPREIPSRVGKLSKTQKRPQRPFGGVLSSSAARNEHKNKARELDL
jgi:large subunit ribosomal protein L34e